LKLAESVAGPVTARILADHFERVILIDPEINDNEKPKTRIMQYNAGHCEIARSLDPQIHERFSSVFLSFFLNGARRLWPNFDEEFLAAGGRYVGKKHANQTTNHYLDWLLLILNSTTQEFDFGLHTLTTPQAISRTR
jgi:hypothetical protein